MGVRIEDLTEGSIEDRISVCGESQPMELPSVRKGIREKKRWLRRMLREVGAPSKILYVDGKPVGQVQYYPESSIPFLKKPDPKTLHVMCSFVHLAHQGKGFGSMIFKSLLTDVKDQGRFDRLETLSFDPPGCGFAQTVFWKHMGFRQKPEGRSNELQYPVRGGLTLGRRSRPKQVRERGVKIFYQPTCIFSHHFTDKIVNAIHEIDPKTLVEKINMWEKPELAMQRDITEACVYVNGRPMKHSIFDVEEFKKEAGRLLTLTK